jgi:hypothetical protein
MSTELTGLAQSLEPLPARLAAEGVDTQRDERFAQPQDGKEIGQ